MRIALFITCYNDLLFPEVGRAMVRLLRRLGHDVEFPAEQTCCGQMHFNSGYQDACIPLVERFVEAFAGYDASSRRRARAPRWSVAITRWWRSWRPSRATTTACRSASRRSRRASSS